MASKFYITKILHKVMYAAGEKNQKKVTAGFQLHLYTIFVKLQSICSVNCKPILTAHLSVRTSDSPNVLDSSQSIWINDALLYIYRSGSEY